LDFYPKGKLFLLNLYSTLQSMEICGAQQGFILYFSNQDNFPDWKRILHHGNWAGPLLQQQPSADLIWPTRPTPLSACAPRQRPVEETDHAHRFTDRPHVRHHRLALSSTRAIVNAKSPFASLSS
jgi:hypothetical protein